MRGRKGSWIGQREKLGSGAVTRGRSELYGEIRSWNGPLELSSQGKEARLLYPLLTPRWLQAAPERGHHLGWCSFL